MWWGRQKSIIWDSSCGLLRIYLHPVNLNPRFLHTAGARYLNGIYDSTCYHYGGDRGKFGKEALVKLEADCADNAAHGGGTRK